MRNSRGPNNNGIFLALALLVVASAETVNAQTASTARATPAIQESIQTSAANVYVIRHHGIRSGANHPLPGASTPAISNVGPEEATESDALCRDGAAQVKNRNLKLAQDDYNQALGLWPDSKTALYGAAECAVAAADFPRAVSYYRSAIYSSDPSRYGMVPGDGFQENDTSRLMQFASVLSRSGQADEGVFVYNRAAGLLNYEDSQYHNGKPSLKVLLSELSTKPTSPEQVQYTPERLQALADTAFAYEEMGFGSEKKAITHMKEAAKLYPNSAAIQYYLGEALSRSYYVYLDSSVSDKKATWAFYLEDKKAAEAAYKKAAELGDDATVAAAKERLAAPR